MEQHDSQPTPEMIAFYESRTREHIERVRRCLHAIADATSVADELRQRALVHDESKFSDAERIPYIWMTEFHRCRRAGESFSYPDGMDDRVRDAIAHHMSTNRHHPEFHDTPTEMNDADLIEMVCDWTAMAQEFGENDGSAREYADRTIGQRLHLPDDRTQFVYRMIDLLDKRLARQDNSQ